MQKSVLFFLCFLGITNITYTQYRDLQKLPQTWSLQDCIGYAKQNNIQLNSLRLSRSSAELDLVQSENNRLPNVSGSASQSMVNSKNANPVVGGFQTQARFSSNYGVSSSMTLYNGGYLKNNIKAKKLSVASAGLTIDEAANDITLNITQAFLDILLAQENTKTLRELLLTSQAQFKQAQQRYSAGSISKKELLQFESQLAADNYNVVMTNNAYRLNLALLKQILQLPYDYELVIVIPENIEPLEIVLSLENAQKAAVENRPEVKNNELAIRLAEVELDKTRAGRLPTVNLGAGLSTGYSDNRTSPYFSQIGDNFYQSVNLNASIPIFSRNLNKTNIEKSKIVIEQAKLTLDYTKTILVQQVEQAYINLQNAQAQYAVAATQLRIAEETYHISNEQLRLGAISMVEVLQQKNTYVQALQSYVQAKYTAVLYTKIYKFYTGESISF